MLASPSARGARRIAHAIDRSGGADALRREAAAFRAAGRGDEVLLGDLSPRLQREVDFAANNSEDAYTDIADRLYARQEGAAQRVLNDVTDVVGDADAERRLGELRTSRSQWAGSDAGYEGLRQRNPTLAANDVAERLEQFIAQPRISGMWDEAQRIGYIGATPNLRGQLSFQTLQNFKEQLDNAVSRAFRDGAGDLGTKLREVRDEVVRTMGGDDVTPGLVPGYRDVAQEYGRRVGLETAVEGGAEAWLREDTRQLAALVSALPGPALLEFRLGMASRLIAQLRNAATNRGEAERLTRASPALQDKLRVIFGDEATFQRFMQRAQREAQMGRTRSALGGAATHRRGQAAAFDPAELVNPAALQPSAWPGMAAGMGAKMMRGALGRRTASEMAPTLMMQGADTLDDFLANLSMRQPLVGRGFTQGAPLAAASLLDHF